MIRDLAIFLKSRAFALVRKLAFLLVLTVLAGSAGGGVLAKLIVFSLAYLSLYAFNDLIDYESDRKRKVLRPSKVLARGEVSLPGMVMTAATFLSLSALLSPLFLSTRETLILFLAILLGILRSLNRRLIFRSVSLFILELLNLVLFASFLNISPPWGVILLISLYYSVNYYLYKAYEKNRSVIRLYDPILLLSLIACALLHYSLLFRVYLAISSLIFILSWKRSLESASHAPALAGGLLFVVLSLIAIWLQHS